MDNGGLDANQGRERPHGVLLVVSLDGPDGDVEVAFILVVQGQGCGANRLAGARAPLEPTSLDVLHRVEASDLERQHAVDSAGHRGVDRDRGSLVGQSDHLVDALHRAGHSDDLDAQVLGSGDESVPLLAERGDNEVGADTLGD